ncbi:MAG: hypothetical protein GX111_03290 [Clostridiales bacterium]|jgi:X-X-X-Leu-X-X-Gly heptad repeat protein|nr:hypothetical protein [Clostridiales bacterium]
MKKITIAATVIALLISLSSVAAVAPNIPPKEEVVYGILNYDGNVEEIYVVNSFRGGDITDYGTYSSVLNLNTADAITKNGDEITIQSSADKLYYQGTLVSTELPWNIEIRYMLNGAQISGAELGGKSGELEIKIAVTRNPNVNRFFFDNYALQIGVTLDTDLCGKIETKDATVASAGTDKQLSYTVLPGNDADISIKTDVRDFEMDALSINGIRLSMTMNFDTTQLLGDMNELIGAIAGLDDGAGELQAGAAELTDGMKTYVSGLLEFSGGMAKLNLGVGDLSNGAASLSDGLNELTAQNEALQIGAQDILQSAFDAVNQQLALAGMENMVLTPENYKAALENNPMLADALARLDGAVRFSQGLTEYTNAVAQLGAGAAELKDGIDELKYSVSALSYSANELYKAGSDIGDAMAKLRDGLSAYKDGTSELNAGLSGMDEVMNRKIDDILKPLTGNGEPAVSFVSEKNTGVTAVQFVLKTAAIEKPAAGVPPQPEPAPLNFWQKLLRLFGINA